jgi:murein DD-endopeptidase MepM/ murein hydrolase activator NlpD
VFLSEPEGLQLAGAAGGVPFGRARAPIPQPGPVARARLAAERTDWVPDLGARIGSRTWWRGLVTLGALTAAAWATHPEFGRPLPGFVPAALTGEAREEARTQAIAPLALGATTGRRMAASDLVRPLAETPERPVIELTATLGDGDRFESLLSRAGVGRTDAARAADLVADAVSLGDLPTGTLVQLTLGRRADRRVARPLERLAFRARFDLNLTVARQGDALTLERQPIAVDHTPLRIRGLVGSSLYRSARAAGAPAGVVEAYIKALATRLSVGSDVSSADTFDLIAEQERAATGEVRIGKLQYAGLDRGRHKLELVRWEGDGVDGWLDRSATYERRGFFGMPVDGRITSSFGLRMHPLLGRLRMHKGVDIGAPYGSPIYAAMEGTVGFAGRRGGYGNYVSLNHAGGVESAYGHMSRIAVRPGARVSRGQVIGYVGSTGMSTGPHLHWEVMRRGQPIDPRRVSISRVVSLSGSALRAFRAKLAGLLAVGTSGR